MQTSLVLLAKLWLKTEGISKQWMQALCSASLLAPWQHPGGWRLTVIRLWQNGDTRQAQGEMGEERRERRERKAKREGQVPASPVKHISWVLSSSLVGCFPGFSTHRSDSWWGLFILTFKDCHNTFNTPANLRSALGCSGLCKHAPLLLRHRKGHRRVSFPTCQAWCLCWGWNTSGLIYDRAHEWPFSAVNVINITRLAFL